MYSIPIQVCNHPYLFFSDTWPTNSDIVRSSGKFELLDRMLPKLKAAGHRVLMFSQVHFNCSQCSVLHTSTSYTTVDCINCSCLCKLPVLVLL
jgi:hypothetical protein